MVSKRILSTQYFIRHNNTSYIYTIRPKRLILKPENLFPHSTIYSGCPWYVHPNGICVCVSFEKNICLYSMDSIYDSQFNWFSPFLIKIKIKSFYCCSLVGIVVWFMTGNYRRNNCKTTPNFQGKEEIIRD